MDRKADVQHSMAEVGGQPPVRGGSAARTCAMNICSRHFLKLRSSVQAWSSTCRALATCSLGTIRQCPGTSRPLQPSPATLHELLAS